MDLNKIDEIKPLYEMLTNFEVDISKSNPYIVKAKIVFHDLVFLDHIKDYYEKKHISFDSLFLNCDNFFGYPIVSIEHGYFANALYLKNLINKGDETGFRKPKTALKYINAINKEINRAWLPQLKVYEEAKTYLEKAY